MDPKDIQDPAVRKEYEAAIEENRERTERLNRLRAASRLLDRLQPHIRNVIRQTVEHQMGAESSITAQDEVAYLQSKIAEPNHVRALLAVAKIEIAGGKPMD